MGQENNDEFQVFCYLKNNRRRNKMKTYKKFAVSILTALVITMTFIMPAFASEDMNNNNISTQEEAQKVQELWDAAVAQGNPVYTDEDLKNMPMPRIYDQISGSYYQYFPSSGQNISVGFALTADINSPYIGTVYNFVMYPNGTAMKSIDNLHYQVTHIDGGRTAAVNCSGTATADYWSVTHTVAFTKYIEFYGTGGYRVY